MFKKERKNAGSPWTSFKARADQSNLIHSDPHFSLSKFLVLCFPPSPLPPGIEWRHLEIELILLPQSQHPGADILRVTTAKVKPSKVSQYLHNCSSQTAVENHSMDYPWRLSFGFSIESRRSMGPSDLSPCRHFFQSLWWFDITTPHFWILVKWCLHNVASGGSGDELCSTQWCTRATQMQLFQLHAWGTGLLSAAPRQAAVSALIH